MENNLEGLQVPEEQNPPQVNQTPTYQSPVSQMQDAGLNSSYTPPTPVSTPVVEPYTTTPEPTFDMPVNKMNIRDWLMGNKKIVGIAGGGIVLAALLIGGSLWYMGGQPVQFSVSANQTPFSLSANGQDFKDITSPTTIALKEGTYTLTATKDGYIANSRQFTVTKQTKGAAVSFSLQEKPGVTPVLAKAVLFPVFNPETNALLYFTKSDAGYNLMEYRIDTQTETAVTNKPIASISNVTWSGTYSQLAVTTTNSSKTPDGLLSYIKDAGDDTSLTWVITLDRRDLVNISLKNLHPSIRNVSFSPEGDKISYFFDGAGEKVIATSNNDGSNYERILKLESMKNPATNWSPDGSKIAIYPKKNTDKNLNLSSEKNDLYIYSFETRSLSKISATGDVSDIKWASDGNHLIYESDSNLWLASVASGVSNEMRNQDLKVSGKTFTTAWINNTTVITLDNNSLVMIKISSDGVAQKQPIELKETNTTSQVQTLLSGSNSAYLVGASDISKVDLSNLLK
ncbi:MAG: DPP IV N-terminal domain-containing protein [Patescibacteria group bacterium]